MRTFLSHDKASGELRLVMTDLWDGQHERTEFRVIDDDGRPVRRGERFDGEDAYRDSFGGYYVKVGPSFDRRTVNFRAEQTATGPTVKTPCRRAASKSGRANCALCG